MKQLCYFLGVLMFMLSACHRHSSLSIYQVEPLTKVLSTDSVFIDQTDTMWVARGENAAFQFVVTSKQDLANLQATVRARGLGDLKIGWVHQVYNTNVPKGADDLITTPDNYYPDPIIDDETENIELGKSKTLWVDIYVPRTTEAGIYKCQLTVQGETESGISRIRKNFFVKVCPVTLPEEQQLKVVNWYSRSDVKYLDEKKNVEIGSERYLQLLQLIAETGASYGQNCWLIQEKPDLKLNADSTDFVLDFTCFDKAMEMFIKHGNLKFFCNSHLGGRGEGKEWNQGHYFNLAYVKDKKIVQEYVPYTDARLKTFIGKYYSQLESHFREKNWLGMCAQHIADEPDRMGTESQQSWSQIAAWVKEAAPGLKTIDASSEIVDNQDIGVVLLGENISSMPAVPEGSERWMYTCTGPQGNYANRFIQLPLIKTRILHWINFKYNECGYLHWGFNYWQFSKDPLHDVTPSTNWPGGDCYIIYPGKGKVYPSIRLCAMREGIRDYDLLRMVQQVDPRKANAWCNSIVLNPDDYNMDIKHFYQVRREILTFLSQQ